MPAKKDVAFSPPADLNIPVWRYMDFTKFISMLDSKSIFFSRADLLGDPFEGSTPKANWIARQKSVEAVRGNSPIGPEQVTEMYRTLRQAAYISCWHMNQGESAAMWKLYAQTKEAVAIRTSFARLDRALDDETCVGVVHYIDFETTAIDTSSLFYQYTHKRRSFAHEHELRAFVFRAPIDPITGTFDRSFVPPLGISKPIALDELIEAVYVAPTCPPWFTQLVRRVVSTYGLNAPVLQSSLDNEPLF